MGLRAQGGGPDCRAWEVAGEPQQASEHFLGYQSDPQTRSGMANVGLEALIPPDQQHGASISMGQSLVRPPRPCSALCGDEGLLKFSV